MVSPGVILLELIYAIIKEINRQIGHKEIMDNSANDIFEFNLESITGATDELVIKINIKLDEGKEVKYNGYDQMIKRLSK